MAPQSATTLWYPRFATYHIVVCPARRSAGEHGPLDLVRLVASAPAGSRQQEATTGPRVTHAQPAVTLAASRRLPPPSGHGPRLERAQSSRRRQRRMRLAAGRPGRGSWAAAPSPLDPPEKPTYIPDLHTRHKRSGDSPCSTRFGVRSTSCPSMTAAFRTRPSSMGSATWYSRARRRGSDVAEHED